MSEIVIYTDGGNRNNQSENSIGAWAYTLTHNGETRENYGVELNSTNNIQEMKACVEALRSIDEYDIPIKIHSDSAYLINGIGKTQGTGWVDNWKKNDWTRGKKKEAIMNLELWKELDELRCKFDSVEFVKVKGHSDSEGNNRVDALVNLAMDEYLKRMEESK